MARRLILDTGLLIAAERGRIALHEVLAEDDDIVIAAVTVAELLTGVELASERKRVGRAEFVRSVLQTLPVEHYDLTVAQTHSRLLAHVHRTGSRRGAHDLIIAATAAATGRVLISTDRSANFQDLPGVDCTTVEPM